MDYIGQLEVGLGKIEYEGTLDDLYKSDINKYVEYNLNDVIIVKKLDDKLKFIDLPWYMSCGRFHMKMYIIQVDIWSVFCIFKNIE